MPLNIGESDFVPYVKYNAKQNAWFIRRNGGDEPLSSDTEFKMDMKNIQTGWLVFIEGTAPVRAMDPSLTETAPKPNHDKARRGFVVAVSVDGVKHEFSSASGHVGRAISSLYDTWSRATNTEGKVAVVVQKDAKRMRDKAGTNYMPVFEIKGLVDRPAELPDELPVS